MPKKIQNKKNITKSAGTKAKLSRTWRIFRITLQTIIIGGLVITATAATLFVWFTKDLPRPEKFGEGLIIESTKIYARGGELLYELSGNEKRTTVSFDKVSDSLKKAILAIEDKNFYEHSGVDFKSIARAVIYDLKIRKTAQGASTISQQLIRNYFLTQKKSLKRKTQELVLTLELERRYAKNQIFEWYLNIIPFGGNLYGVESTSRAFFNKSASEISVAQSAILAALIQSPSHYSPYGPNLLELLERKNLVLSLMKDQGSITQDQYEQAKSEKIEFSPNITAIKAPHFVMFVKNYLEKKYGADFLPTAGWQVKTTLDLPIQETAEKVITTRMETVKKYGANNAALVAINPKNGEILAMVGSKNFFATSSPSGCKPGLTCKFDPETNVATSPRQPGSSFKPFAYAQAFWAGFSPETVVWDVPTEFNVNCAPNALQVKDSHGLDCYSPRNYDGGYKGLISLRNALAQSRNIPAVKVLYLAGLKKVLELAKDFGITTLADEKRYGLSLVLGGGEVKLLEMATGYSVFADDGIKNNTIFITEIRDSKGNLIEKANPTPFRVLPAQVARQINDVLSDNNARAPMFGANSSLYLPDYQAAAKTGTTQDTRDAWCMGYTPTLVAGTWVGNNDNSPMTQGGAVASGPMWKDFMEAVLPKFPKENFTAPQIAISNKPMLDGTAGPSIHTILYYVNKNYPQGGDNSQSDSQFYNWETAVQNWTGGWQ
jgi:penicillin-binding protein 1C